MKATKFPTSEYNGPRHQVA